MDEQAHIAGEFGAMANDVDARRGAIDLLALFAPG